MNASFSSYNFPPVTELVFPTEWESSENDRMLFATGPEDSYNVTTSSEAPETINNMVVLNMMNHQDDYYDDDQDMQDAGGVFQTRPLEELFNNALYFDNDDDYHNIDQQGGFFDPLLNVDTTDHHDLYGDDSSTASIGLPLEERYKATLEKLQASMRRSQETRNCLTMKTATTESYERVGSVKEILSSIATSSGQVQQYVTTIQRPTIWVRSLDGVWIFFPPLRRSTSSFPTSDIPIPPKQKTKSYIYNL